VARDSEKPDLGADAVNLSSRAQARGRIAGERAGEIDDWDLPLHCFHSMLAHETADWTAMAAHVNAICCGWR
jgi:hypothetical protein